MTRVPVAAQEAQATLVPALVKARETKEAKVREQDKAVPAQALERARVVLAAIREAKRLGLGQEPATLLAKRGLTTGARG